MNSLVVIATVSTKILLAQKRPLSQLANPSLLQVVARYNTIVFATTLVKIEQDSVSRAVIAADTPSKSAE
ncbi:MAG: hypothetical protein LBF84_02530 [Holosporales bacterium]|nr:hypothetical protein [Holosporales bacterium]